MAANPAIETEVSLYHYASSTHSHTCRYLLPTILKTLRGTPPPARIFELGCGNGAMANELSQLGYEVTAVDPSIKGVAIARENFANCRFELGSAYDELNAQYGAFNIVLSLEVVEHIFYPRRYAATIADLLLPDGVAIISTPYHGYFKNLTLALLNKWESHADPLWDYGHIKLWTRPKLKRLFEEVGMEEVGFYRIGRIPQLAKSMIMIVKKRRSNGAFSRPQSF
jgi:SAM-dependent methyltransferase